MGSQRLATGHGLGAWVQCSESKHSTAQHSTRRAPYLPTDDRILYVNRGALAGAVPSPQQIHCCCAPPCLSDWFEIYLALLLSLEDQQSI